MRKSTLAFVVILFLISCAIRCAIVWTFRDINNGPEGGASDDFVQFELLARNLVEGRGYRLYSDSYTSFRAPGFPFALALVYWTIGDQPAVAYAFFCILGALSCVLTYLLAREFLTENGARLAGLLNAVYLPHAYFATLYCSENVYVPCLALALWCAVRYVKGGATCLIALAGAILGYATLVRPGTVFMLPLIPAALLIHGLRGAPGRFRACAAYVAAFAAVLAPWTWRNYEVHGHWVLVATNGGSTFWGANNDRVLNETQSLGYWISTAKLPNRHLIDAAPNEYEHDQAEWKLGKAWVRENLASLPKLELLKLARLWWLPEYGAGWRWLRIASYGPFFLLFAAFALRCVWRKSFWTPSWQVLHLSTLALFATTLVFFGEPRFRDAQTPVLMIYAALGADPRFHKS
jgi:4-amino-4-deoxy-L-arabinose transferase-like glycosyltransferase